MFFYLIVLGLSGLVAEILLLKELWISVISNEFYTGIIFATWVLIEAIGSFTAGKFIKKIKNKNLLFFILNILFLFFFYTQTYLIRSIRLILNLTPGESPDFFSLFIYSFFILFPVAFIHGVLFPVCCAILEDKVKKLSSSGFVYVIETAGNILGGIVYTFVLNIHILPFWIITLVSFLNLIALFFILKKYRLIIAVLSFALLFFSLFNFPSYLEKSSLKKQWYGKVPIFYKNTFYGNITVIKDKEEYNYYFQGKPVISAPAGDIPGNEEFVHIPLLFLNKPSDILIIGGGAGGIIREILKHKEINRIDYIEIDPYIFKAIKKIGPGQLIKEIENPVVNLHSTDPLIFLKKQKNKYDIIFSGFSLPDSIQINRFFTREFFAIIKTKLKPDGLYVLSLPGSPSFLSRELSLLNGSIFLTLKKVFPFVKVVPGENILFISSGSKIHIENLDKRFKKIENKTKFLTINYLKYKLSTERKEWFLKSIKSVKAEINLSYSPKALFYATEFTGGMLTYRLKPLFQFMEKINLWKLIIPVLILYGILIIFSKSKRLKIITTIFTTGFSGMFFYLLFTAGIQIFWGSMYYYISLFVSIFMAGITAGGLFTSSKIRYVTEKYIKIFELLILLFTIFIYLILYFKLSVLIIFMILTFTGGFLTGCEFPAGVKLYRKEDESERAGIIYATDLIGGCVGGFLSSVLLLSWLGFLKSLIFVFILKLLNLIFLTRK